MRPEKNPLDLNNLPDDYTRDGKVVFEEGFSSGSRKKKNGGKDGKDECGKVYECRFCSLKFCKSQALGGHMNRHRQERETETLNRARQLVFNNDTLSTQAHLGYHPVGGNMGDPTLQFRSVYPPRMLPPPPPPPSQQPYLHQSPSRLGSYTSQYPINDYYVGHVLGSTGSSQYTHHQQNLNCLGGADTNYTCIGAPVGFGPGSSRGADVSMSSYAAGGGGGGVGGTHANQRLENPSAINRFQDGF